MKFQAAGGLAIQSEGHQGDFGANRMSEILSKKQRAAGKDSQNKQNKKNQYAARILGILKKSYPRAKIALGYSNPLELLIAVMLSAQCTDKRVNIVTQSLFRKYRTLTDFVNADIRELEQDIRSTGFYRNKAKNIKASCQIILEEFGGRVPDSMQDILKLPGVARKTANIVLGNAYGVIDGIAVDTHVSRLSQRLGLSANHDPNKIEQDLMGLYPKNIWLDLTYYIIEHGRAVCKAPTPICSHCQLSKLCPKKGVKKSK